VLDVGLSADTNAERKPKWSPGSSAATLTTGRFNWRPMASALSLNVTLCTASSEPGQRGSEPAMLAGISTEY
jgi:hypothetical protein